jgi:uncharacterized protein involved in type VI secretion and phage assembly
LPGYKPWARVMSIGGGPNRGFAWVPQIDDEVLVAFNQNDERDAYILGGLWNTLDRSPLTTPVDAVTKRIIKTGTKLTPGLAHEVEFDDALQSITITSSTGQTITLDPTKIELQDTSKTLSIKLDTVKQTVSINSSLKLELKAVQVSIEAATLDLKGASINVQATGPCNVQGLPIKLN